MSNDVFTARREEIQHDLTELLVALSIPDQSGDDGVWRMGQQDEIDDCIAQMAVLDHILSHTELQTPTGLATQLRALFNRYDDIESALDLLPCFDDVEDRTLTPDEEVEYQAYSALHREMFLNHCQHELVGELAGVSERRLYEIRHIIGSHHEPVDLQEACGDVQTAGCYPMVKSWIDHGGNVVALPIPEEVSAWMKVGVNCG